MKYIFLIIGLMGIQEWGGYGSEKFAGADAF